MKILITGATGYIGNRLATESAQRGHQTHILVRNVDSSRVPRHERIVAFAGDLENKESVINAMRGCQGVLHSAAIARFSGDSSIFYRVNVEGTRNVLDAALELGIQKLVFTSSGAVLGPSAKFPLNEEDPRISAFENDYEISKFWAEQLIREYCSRGLDAVIVAPTRVYGPGLATESNALGQWLQSVFSLKLAILPGDGKTVGNYAYIDDVVMGHFLALQKGKTGEKYILGGENISYVDLVRAAKKYSGRRIYRVHLPGGLLAGWAGAHRFFSKLLRRPTQISPAFVRRLMLNRALSCNKAVEQLGYSITPFEEGMRQTIIHLKKHVS